MAHRIATRRLGFESLEKRNLLAGNVLVQPVGGVLFITGDDQDNAIVVETNPDGDCLIRRDPRRDSVKDPTLINGQQGTAEFSGVRDIVVRLGDGDDSFVPFWEIQVTSLFGGLDGTIRQTVSWGPHPTFRNAAVPGNLFIDMGPGDDYVSLCSPRRIPDMDVRGNLSVRGGPGDDRFTCDLFVRGNLNVQMGQGDDHINLRRRADGNTLLDGGDGADRVFLSKYSSKSKHHDAGCMSILTGAGDDRVDAYWHDAEAAIAVDTGSGNDSVRLDGSHIDNLRVSTGSGNDKVQVILTTIVGSLTLDTAGGDDRISIGSLLPPDNPQPPQNPHGNQIAIQMPTGRDATQWQFGLKTPRLVLRTGGGDDELMLYRSHVDATLVADLGWGNDEVDCFDNTLGRSALLDGGFGTDGLNDDLRTTNEFTRLRCPRFESPASPPADVVGAALGQALDRGTYADALNALARDLAERAQAYRNSVAGVLDAASQARHDMNRRVADFWAALG